MDNLKLLEKTVNSSCEIIRFGSEFCEYNMPSLVALEKAYEIVKEKGKQLIYITPRLSNAGIKIVEEHFNFLNEKGNLSVVVNDIGSLNLLVKKYHNLNPRIGRQLIRIPARSPWIGTMIKDVEPTALTHTSLNYRLTIDFFKKIGISSVDLDWIPSLLPSIECLSKEGFNISVHLYLLPITATRKCHTARFLGEESPKKCSKPCLERAFFLKHEILGLELFIDGNAVFRYIQPSMDIGSLRKVGVAEIVLPVNPITNLDSSEKLNDNINFLLSQ